ncbi:MAG: OsmC family protein [Chloroflexia bacterium]
MTSPPSQVFEPVDASRYESKALLAMPDATSGMAFLSTAPSGHTITIDTGSDSGGANSGPEPLALLLLSLGSCVGMDVISILRKKRQVVTNYSINVYANQATEHPQVYTEILVEHVVAGPVVSPEAMARSLEISINKYCPVHVMLAKATDIQHVFRVMGEPETQIGG